MKKAHLVRKLSPSLEGLGRSHFSLSPESDKCCLLTWQVFWLRVYFNAFPLYKTVAKIEASRKPLLRRGLGRPLTATGIAPDFHRTSLLIRQLAEPNRGKCKKRNILSKKSFQQYVIFLFVSSIERIIQHNNFFLELHCRNDWQLH